MPETVPGHKSSSGTPPNGIDEVDALRARVQAAEDRTLDFWLEAVISSTTGSMTVKALQQSVSWRITKPLRATKIVTTRLRQAGLRRTIEMVRERLAQMRQARRRG